MQIFSHKNVRKMGKTSFFGIPEQRNTGIAKGSYADTWDSLSDRASTGPADVGRWEVTPRVRPSGTKNRNTGIAEYRDSGIAEYRRGDHAGRRFYPPRLDGYKETTDDTR